MNNYNQNPESALIIVVFIFFLIFLVIPGMYMMNRELVNHFILSMSAFNLSFFANFSNQAYEEYLMIQDMDEASMDFSDIYTVLKYTGTWVRYPLMCFLLIMGLVSVFISSKRGLCRKFSMKTLLEHNTQNFSCVTPVMGKGEYLLSQTSYDTGLWKVARTPVQFCIENQLLEYPDDSTVLWVDAFKNGVANNNLPAYGYCSLNKAKCVELLTLQLGVKKRNYEELPPVRMALATAFLAFGNENKKDAIEILNTCAVTYFEKDGDAGCKCLSDETFMTFVRNTYSKYEHTTKSRNIDIHKAYEVTWFMALLYFARKKGILAPSQFLFLRPLDRGLWYALHQCGGRTAWAEAVGPWAHYHEEEKTQKTLYEFNPVPAYDFIHETLNTQGWLYYGD